MPQPRGILGILIGLLVVAGIWHIVVPAHSDASTVGRWFSVGFLFGIPLLLIGLLLSRRPWVLMAAVMYGTVGLALDIATLVQEASKTEVKQVVLILEMLSAVLNFLLIACSGRDFLNGSSDGQPAAGRRPNPPSPSSS
jgi:hypothetical protein